MLVVLFRSRFSDQVDSEYDETEQRLARKVREMAGSDLVYIKNYQAEDGERLAVVWWKDPETLAKWRADPEHVDAQDRGKEQWYSFYELSVAEIVRTSSNAESYPGM